MVDAAYFRVAVGVAVIVRLLMASSVNSDYGRSMFVLFAVVMWFMAIVYLFGRHGQNELPGAGIDLANVRRIIECHWGARMGQSRTGAGAAFYLSFPLKGA